MAMKIQKLQITLLGMALLLLGSALPLVVPQIAAAAEKPGTCYVDPANGGTVAGYKQSCSAWHTTSGKDSAGRKLDYSKYCYEVTDTNPVVMKRISCSSSLFGISPAQSQCESNGGTWENGACKNPVNCASANGTTNCDPAVNGGNCSSVQHCDLISKYINPFINFLAALVGVAVVISIVIGGIQYGSSAGDPAKVTAAKNRIRNAIIALVTFLLLYALLNFLIPGGLF